MSELKWEELGYRILHHCRNELYSYFPYLDGAFASVSYKGDGKSGIATEGDAFIFSPEDLIKAYRDSPAVVRRGYLHMLIHCLYLHLFREERFSKPLWDIACDVAVEQMIEGAGIKALEVPSNEVRKRCFRMLSDKSYSPQQIYRLLETGGLPGTAEEIRRAFFFDDHSLWENDSSPAGRARTRRKWEKILAYTGQNKNDRRKRAGTKAGNDEESLEVSRKGCFDYRKFLRRFAVPREEVELDGESFDYVFYHYGMEHYGNMPLVEPLEYKEVHKLEELVIGIDTSGSCSAETVQRFLEETYAILSEKENFFRKMKVFLVQCDSMIQDTAVIHSEEEWKAYSSHVKIHGRGGTDFRPVFAFVEEQKQKKEIQNLKALIYFTDGDGIYPRMKPDYETAFVFLQESPKMELVPSWALGLIAGCEY